MGGIDPPWVVGLPPFPFCDVSDSKGAVIFTKTVISPGVFEDLTGVVSIHRFDDKKIFASVGAGIVDDESFHFFVFLLVLGGLFFLVSIIYTISIYLSIAFYHIFIKSYHTKAKRKAAPEGTAFLAKNAGEDMT